MEVNVSKNESRLSFLLIILRNGGFIGQKLFYLIKFFFLNLNTYINNKVYVNLNIILEIHI